MKLPNLLFHPHVTLAATIALLGAIAASCTAFVAALDPVTRLPFLAQYLPIIQRLDGDIVGLGIVCGALAAALGVIAGLGRSFAPTIDAGPK